MKNSEQKLNLEMYKGEFNRLSNIVDAEKRKEEIMRICLKIVDHTPSYKYFIKELKNAVVNEDFDSYRLARDSMIKKLPDIQKLKKCYRELIEKSSEKKEESIESLVHYTQPTLRKLLVLSSLPNALAKAKPIDSKEVLQALILKAIASKRSRFVAAKQGPKNRSPLARLDNVASACKFSFKKIPTSR